MRTQDRNTVFSAFFSHDEKVWEDFILQDSYRNPKGSSLMFIWDALRDLAPFIRFKKREKHPLKERYF